MACSSRCVDSRNILLMSTHRRRSESQEPVALSSRSPAMSTSVTASQRGRVRSQAARSRRMQRPEPPAVPAIIAVDMLHEDVRAHIGLTVGSTSRG